MSRFLSSRAWAANERVRKEGSAALVEASLSAGVGHYVQESVVMLYPDRGAEWIDEDVPVDRYPIARSNLAAESSAARFAAAGTAVVLRFGWFYGPGATHSEQLLAMARRHVCVQLGGPHGYVSSIDVGDGGRAVVAALGASGGTYNVVDEPLTKREYAEALAAAAGTRPWLRVPGRAALLLGDRTTSLTRSVRASNRRFRTETGWEPRHPSARDGWVTMAAGE